MADQKRTWSDSQGRICRSLLESGSNGVLCRVGLSDRSEYVFEVALSDQSGWHPPRTDAEWRFVAEVVTHDLDTLCIQVTQPQSDLLPLPSAQFRDK